MNWALGSDYDYSPAESIKKMIVEFLATEDLFPLGTAKLMLGATQTTYK